ncbi:vesicular integral-membrane protein VIP36 precursor [Aaosphaeria arxii CBS 175.79]|uniref:Vesicular integral-membrane protein VIP36 n=1 Tax=Aaosphaeria arxii CBS 175.79 TaxID=1450172 RepID=A0A6A5XRW5_9PLEO|nr:vesicular integral-membrane protein VIP36 precursor [Aaosphaeria arxii CBS 175.79]KAF2015491.1 vesicular integral-membrane protein VIP36 precursor [Aaosphaeria arxii CBS 175.79]
MLFQRPWASLCLLAGSLSQSLAAVGLQEHPDIKAISLRTHSLEPPYLDSDMQSRWWDFGDDTIVRTDKYIRLASDKPSRTGWIFSRVPLTATNWEILVEFKISGQGNLYGDGFAMWLTKQRATPGPVFGSVDKFEGLGVFFDTYKNNRPGTVFPYIMAMNGDGKTTYDKDSDGKANEVAGCSARGVRNANIPTKARFTYFADEGLKLDLQYKAEDEWTECFNIANFKVPPVAYLGFSAETGELSDNHDIVYVSTKNLYKHNTGTNAAGAAAGGGGGSGKTASSYSRPQKESGSWTWFFIKFVLFGLALTGAYVGYTVYRTRQRDRF